MDPVSAAGQSIPISELIVELVTAIGVGNFVIVILVLGLVVNSPNIINGVSNFFRNRESRKQLTLLKQQTSRIEQYLEDIEQRTSSSTDSVDVLTNEIKALVSVVDLLHSSIDKENEERRDENVLITNSLEKLSKALESIEKMMRNVISEQDTSELVSFVMGIQVSLKDNILGKTMTSVEQIEEGDYTDKKSIISDLENDIHSTWSDFKNKLSQFNTPVDLSDSLNRMEESLWEEGGVFKDIVSIVTETIEEENSDKSRKKSAIVKRLDIGLRRMHHNLLKELKDQHQQRGA